MHGEPEACLIREDEEAATVAPEINRTACAIDDFFDGFLDRAGTQPDTLRFWQVAITHPYAIPATVRISATVF